MSDNSKILSKNLQEGLLLNKKMEVEENSKEESSLIRNDSEQIKQFQIKQLSPAIEINESQNHNKMQLAFKDLSKLNLTNFLRQKNIVIFNIKLINIRYKQDGRAYSQTIKANSQINSQSSVLYSNQISVDVKLFENNYNSKKNKSLTQTDKNDSQKGIKQEKTKNIQNNLSKKKDFEYKQDYQIDDTSHKMQNAVIVNQDNSNNKDHRQSLNIQEYDEEKISSQDLSKSSLSDSYLCSNSEISYERMSLQSQSSHKNKKILHNQNKDNQQFNTSGRLQNQKPMIILHSIDDLSKNENQTSLNNSPVNKHQNKNNFYNTEGKRTKSISFSHDFKQNLNSLIKKHHNQEMEKSTNIPLDQLQMNKKIIIPENQATSSRNQPTSSRNQLIDIENQQYSVRSRNKTLDQIKEISQDLTPKYQDNYAQRVVQESFANSIKQIEEEAQRQRQMSSANNQLLQNMMAKSKFKSDAYAEKALRILLYKKKEQRNNEDIATLQKATIDMNFFQELLSKKSNVQNNVHQSLCKAMQFEHAPQGSIVFYAGDIPDRFYILLKGEVAVMLKKQQDEIEKSKRLSNIDPTDQNKKSKFTLRKFLIFKKFQRKLKILLIALNFFKRIKDFDKLEDSEKQQSEQKIEDYFNFNQSQMQIFDSRNSIDMSQVQGDQTKRNSNTHFGGQPIFQSLLNQVKRNSLAQPEDHQQIQQSIQHNRKQSIFFQVAQRNKSMLFVPEVFTQNIQQDNSSASQITPTPSKQQGNEKDKEKEKDKDKAKEKEKQKQKKAKIKMDRKKRDEKNQAKLKPVNELKAQNEIKKNLLPSELVLLERKQKEQLKINIEASSKNVTGLFRIPKFSEIRSPDTNQNRRSTVETAYKVNESQQVLSNELSPAVVHVQRQSILETSSNLNSPVRRSVRKSFLTKKIKIDFQKVRLGVRLAKIFEPTSQFPPLNLGGAKMVQVYAQQNEQFQKMLPSLDLMSLENSPHFFDENVFKYFHATNLGEGRVFGDLGILTKKPRAATIVCLEDCYFGVLNIEDYSKILMDQKKKKMQKSIKFFASTINISLSIEKMAKISQFFEKRFFASGERVYDEGDQIHHIFIIKKGEVELFRKMQTCYGINQTQTMNVSIGIIGQKAYFGEDDALFNRRRKYTAIAKTDTKLLMCKKKDFLKLMNEISEMYNVLRKLAIQKEEWRDKTYNETLQTRQQIKKIDNLKKYNIKLNTQHSGGSLKTTQNTEHNKTDPNQFNQIQSNRNIQINQKDFDQIHGEEMVKNQLLKLEQQTMITNQIYSRIKESSPKNEMNSSQIYRQDSVQNSPTNHNSHQYMLSPKSKDNFSNYIQHQILDPNSQQQQQDSIFQPILKNDWIGGGLKTQRCYFKGDYQKLSPHVKQIIAQNPDLIKEGQLKEISCKIQKKKRILERNLSGKQQSALHAFRETRDICIGHNELFKKLEKVAERRKSIKSEDGGRGYILKKGQADIIQGKKTSQQQLVDLIKSYENKQSKIPDLSESLTGEFFIQSQQPQVKKNSARLQRRTNSLNQLLQNSMTYKKDSIIQSNSQNNSQNQIGINTNFTNSPVTSAKIRKSSTESQDNFIFFGQQNAARAIQNKHPFFFQPQHNRIGSFNTYAKNVGLLNSEIIQPLINKEVTKTSNVSTKADQKQNLSLTSSSGFFKPLTEFVSPLITPNASHKSSISSLQLNQTQNTLKKDKIVIVNHMGKPITFTSSLYSSQK